MKEKESSRTWGQQGEEGRKRGNLTWKGSRALFLDQTWFDLRSAPASTSHPQLIIICLDAGTQKGPEEICASPLIIPPSPLPPPLKPGQLYQPTLQDDNHVRNLFPPRVRDDILWRSLHRRLALASHVSTVAPAMTRHNPIYICLFTAELSIKLQRGSAQECSLCSCWSGVL